MDQELEAFTVCLRCCASTFFSSTTIFDVLCNSRRLATSLLVCHLGFRTRSSLQRQCTREEENEPKKGSKREKTSRSSRLKMKRTSLSEDNASNDSGMDIIQESRRRITTVNSQRNKTMSFHWKSSKAATFFKIPQNDTFPFCLTVLIRDAVSLAKFAEFT